MFARILLIAGNYYPEPTGIGRYNTEMIDWLADHGFQCTVVSTYPYYPSWKVQPPYNNKSRWYIKEKKITPGNNTIIIYRCPHYVPNAPTGRKRMLLDFSYFISVTFKLIGLIGKKFDYVINVTPPLPLGIIAALYKRVSGAKFLYHIQDLQIDTAHHLNMVSSKKFINLLLKIESRVLKRADCISTISTGMIKKVKAKTDKKVYLFPNWSNTKMFYPVVNRYNLKSAFGYQPDIPVILYSGAIGEKQGLEAVLEIANEFSKKEKKVQFIICGSGPYKQTLERKAVEKGLNNLSFLPLQPNGRLNDLLNMADVHLVIQKASALDLVMPSKLTTILSVGGLAVITANPGSSLYDLVSEHQMGLLCAPEDTTALADAIEFAVNGDHIELRNNARRYAEEHLSIETIMQKYISSVMCSPLT